MTARKREIPAADAENANLLFESAAHMAYLAYCAGIEPMVRLTLCGSDTEIMTRCLHKAQAKRVTREMIGCWDGNPPIDEIMARMKEKPIQHDRDLAGRMFRQVLDWRAALRQALAAWPTDAARTKAVASGQCPTTARACMDSSWFAKREGISPAARHYAEQQAAPTYRKAERIRAQPSDDEDGFGQLDRRVAGMGGGE